VEDVKAYIESGILELYVLGDVSPEERLQVEGMRSKYPIIKAELDEMEKALEFYAKANAVNPPSENNRNKILNSLVINLGDDRTFRSGKEIDADNVVTLRPSTTFDFYKYAFAASVILLLGSLVALFNVYNKLQQSNQQLVVLNSQNQQFAKQVNFVNDELSVFRDPSYKLLRLKGTPKVPTAGMTVAWNPVKKKVMIDMVDMKLPANDENHQYQLWALVNGKPVDLGVFDKPEADSTDMKPMGSIALADAFAVTLEPKGGSASPTMSEMMVIAQL
jgi:hypothetical protein